MGENHHITQTRIQPTTACGFVQPTDRLSIGASYPGGHGDRGVGTGTCSGGGGDSRGGSGIGAGRSVGCVDSIVSPLCSDHGTCNMLVIRLYM